MIVVEKIKEETGEICCFCEKDATVKINDMPFCSSCGDGELLKITKKCISNLQQATATLKVLPKQPKG